MQCFIVSPKILVDSSISACSARPKIFHMVLLLALTSMFALLVGCGAVHTAIKKGDLDVQTKMSDSVFLEPVKPAHKIIYVSIRNTTDKELTLKPLILDAISQSGFKLTQNPEEAHFMLQAHVLSVGKSDARSAQDALASGHGGAVLGAMLSATSGGSRRHMAGAALLGAAVGVIGDAMVDDTVYSMITDIQVRERPGAEESISQSQTSSSKQGSSTTIKQRVSSAKVGWKTYRTRIVSTANKANLKFEEASESLEKGLVKTISGIFSD